MITVKNISYKIGGKAILHPMSFEIFSGEVTILLGANGAGKSTLMRVLAAEYLPGTGEVCLDERLLGDYTPEALARKRAVLTQQFAVPLPFSCEEIVMMGRYPHQGQSIARQDQEIVTRCMREMDVEAFAGRLFNTLSGGEQQRVQMARVLAQLDSGHPTDTRVLLLDEPTSSLDYLQQQLLLTKVKILADRGYAVVVVLHDLNLAAQYGDHLLLLKEGYLLAEGTREEILQSALVSMAYDMDVEVVTHEDYPFPFLVPALHCRPNLLLNHKSKKNGTYTNQALIEE